MALLSGALIGGANHEEPFFAAWLGYCDGVRYLVECEYPPAIDWIAGLVGALVIGLVVAPAIPLARRRIRPTVFCRSCPGAGWIEDLVPRDGRCPRCGGSRFDHERTALDTLFAGESVFFLPRRDRERDVAGSDLVARLRAGKRT